MTEGRVTALSPTSYPETEPAFPPDAPTFDPTEIWHRHGPDLLRYYAFPMLLDEEAARAVVSAAFRRLDEDWAQWSREGLSIEDCLWRRTVLLIREHPGSAAPAARRGSGNELLNAIAALDVAEREVVVLHDVDPARRSGPRVLDRPPADLEATRARAHDRLRAWREGAP